MRAVRFDRFGFPSEIQIQELPHPVLQPGEVLVEVQAASVNPSDVKNVMGKMKGTTLPRTPGRDFAGVVVEGPPHLTGSEVWGTGGDIGFTRDGSHASHIVLPVEAVGPKPRNLSMQEAAAVGVGYITAWLCLIETARLQAGETLLVVGATGGVGSAAVQIAKWKGARVLGTVRRESDRSGVIQAGADVAIDLGVQDLQDAVLSATEGLGVSAVLDTVGGSILEMCLGALSRKGRAIAVSAPADPRITFDLRDFYRRELRLFGVDSRTLDAIACGQMLATIAPGFEENALRPPAIAPYPLADAAAAYEQVLNRTDARKVVLIP